MAPNPMQFQIRPASGGWRVRFTSVKNGKVILWSQVYDDRRDAVYAAALAKTYARTAPIKWFRRLRKAG